MDGFDVRTQAAPDRTVRLAGPMVIGLYGLLGFAAYRPLLTGGPHRFLGSDPVQTAWFFSVIDRAILSGHNPFFTSAVNAPYGFNVAEAAAMPLLAVLTLPLTVVAGPLTSVKLCFVAAMPLSAASAYFVLRKWHVWMPAAAIGGFIYGFSPFMIAQGVDHLNLLFVPLPPLIVALLVKILVTDTNPIPSGLKMAALVSAQFLLSSEILALTAVVASIGIAIWLAWFCPRPRAVLRLGSPQMAAGLTAIMAAGAVLAYPLWWQFAGPLHYSGPPWPVNNRWHADILDVVAPTPLQAFAPVFRHVGAVLSANAGTEDGAYLGLPVIFGILPLVSACRRSRPVRMAAVLAAVSAVLCLGPRLTVAGSVLPMPMPFAALTHVPGIADVLPIRFAWATDACLAAAAAFALNSLHQHTKAGSVVAGRGAWVGRRERVVLTLGAIVALITWMPAWPYGTAPVRSLPIAVSVRLPPGDPILLTYPYAVSPEAAPLLWQVLSGRSFRLVGMYGMVPDSNGRATVKPPLLSPPSVQEFLVAQYWGPNLLYPGPDEHHLVSDVRLLIAGTGISAVVVDLRAHNSDAVRALVQSALGSPEVVTGDFALWRAR